MPMSLIYLGVSMSEHASLSCNLAACSQNLMPSLSQRLLLWFCFAFRGVFRCSRAGSEPVAPVAAVLPWINKMLFLKKASHWRDFMSLWLTFFGCLALLDLCTCWTYVYA
jgi:hypothetical protein